jgi:hypothetical protein
MAENSRKISANLPQSTIDQLSWLAQQRGTTMTEVLRRAVEHETFFATVEQEGGKVLTERPDGVIERVLLK